MYGCNLARVRRQRYLAARPKYDGSHDEAGAGDKVIQKTSPSPGVTKSIMINLIIILAFIVFLLREYFKIDKISYYLMIPYFLWSTYALILNSYIFIYN